MRGLMERSDDDIDTRSLVHTYLWTGLGNRPGQILILQPRLLLDGNQPVYVKIFRSASWFLVILDHGQSHKALRETNSSHKNSRSLSCNKIRDEKIDALEYVLHWIKSHQTYVSSFDVILSST